MKTKIELTLGFFVLHSAFCLSAHAQGTAFTYQGRLNSGANAANGSYDLTFALYATSSGGSAVAGPLTNSATGVTTGLFTVSLDFGGGVFTGSARWLEIGVRTSGNGAFITLAPRQQITPTPYAITAGTAATLAIPAGMALIPAGAYTMGDNLDGESDATPTVSVTVSAFYMDVNLVSYSQWQSVYYWATNHGYGFANAGAGKAANHPVQTVDWYDCVKWCNARSQQAGKTPVYYTDAGFSQVYTNGEVAAYANWTASGYRLPTEAEWEKAARGGLSGQRFPWGNLITENLANYEATNSYSYDLGPNGYNAAFTNGVMPYTSPAGYFAPNGYGLYDMTGNVWEWCWDWYGTPYAGGTDPRGPASGLYGCRMARGGTWGVAGRYVRCAQRGNTLPVQVSYYAGFRCVLPQ